MKRFLYMLCAFCFLLLWSSCRKDFEFSKSTGSLSFSKNPVYLDTIFTNIGSSTYNLKVYNRSDNDIVIPTVGLAKGNASNYRLNVDGQAGKTFNNIELLAKDSLFVFIETTVDITKETTSKDFLYTDDIVFDSGANEQRINLVTLVKDAVFIYPEKDNTTGVIETLSINVNGTVNNTEIKGRELLLSELTFTNDKPYVIYGYAAVPNGETLTINAGARIHFHNEAGLLVNENASLKVNGALSTDDKLLEKEVIFEGDRLEPSFSDVPGQWGAIWLSENSVNNSINYATIKNGTIGLLVDANANTNKLTITNSQIYNFSNFGILGRNTAITAENIVINNAGQSSFAATLGGKYNVTHSTIANYWSANFRQFPALFLSNNLLDNNNTLLVANLSEANFNNCIIYGNENNEISFSDAQQPGVDFNFKFTNNLIHLQVENPNLTGPNYDFTNAALYTGNIYNKTTDFKAPFENDLRIGTNSKAINIGDSSFATQVPTDIKGTSRTAQPDAGAYQNIMFQ